MYIPKAQVPTTTCHSQSHLTSAIPDKHYGAMFLGNAENHCSITLVEYREFCTLDDRHPNQAYGKQLNNWSLLYAIARSCQWQLA